MAADEVTTSQMIPGCYLLSPVMETSDLSVTVKVDLSSLHYLLFVHDLVIFFVVIRYDHSTYYYQLVAVCYES